MSSRKYAKEPAAAVAEEKPMTSAGISAAIVSSYGVAQPLLKRILGGAFYVSLGAFLIFALLVILHYTTTPVFSFGIDDTGLIALPSPDAEQQSAERVSPSTPIALAKLEPYNYTMSFTVNIKGSFTLTRAPLVLLYRSATPVAVPESTTASDLPGLFPSTNLVLYIDPVRNDLQAHFQCINNKSTGLPQPIQNIPVAKPFRITMVVTCQYVEFYLNGQLMQTVVLPDRLKDATTPFFGPPEIATSTVEISNIAVWNQILSSRVIRIKGAL